jgi:hypothetical protein
MYIQKVFFEIKRRKQVENFAVFVELKKKQNCLQFSKRYQEINFFLWLLKKNLIFSFKFDKNYKISNLLPFFEFDENFFNVHFFEMPTCFYLFSAETYTRVLRLHIHYSIHL